VEEEKASELKHPVLNGVLCPKSERKATTEVMDKDKELRLSQLLLIEPSKRTKRQKAELDALIKEKKADIEKRYRERR